MAEGLSPEISDDDEDEFDEEVLEFLRAYKRGVGKEFGKEVTHWEGARGNPIQHEIQTNRNCSDYPQDSGSKQRASDLYKQGTSSGVSELSEDDGDEFDDEVVEFIRGSDAESLSDYDESFLRASSSEDEDDGGSSEYPKASKDYTEEVMKSKCDFYHLLKDSEDIEKVKHLYRILDSGAELGKMLSKITRQLLIKFQQTMSRLAEVRGAPGKFVERKPETENVVGFYLQFCSPYFKDSRYFAAPPTKDYSTKKANNELVTLDIVEAPWRTHELTLMENCVKDCLVEEYATEYSRKRLYLEADRVPPEDYAKIVTQRPIRELLAKIPPEREFDWLKMSQVIQRHSETECQRLWHLFAKPHINKKPFTKEENTLILKFADKYDKQCWDRIAIELETGRSAYQVFTQFMTVLKGGFSAGKWTPEEDSRLSAIVKSAQYRNYISWPKVCFFMEDRAFQQIYARWCYSLNPDLKKGKFSEEEDKLIGRALDMTEISDTKSIASFLGNRNPAQVRERLKSQVLNRKGHKMGGWTLKEDKLLLDLVEELGEYKWAEIAAEFKTRTRTQVRQRYNRLKKKMMETPDFKLTLMNRWNRGYQSNRICGPGIGGKGKKRKRKSGKNPAEEPSPTTQESLELLVRNLRPPTSQEDVLRQMEMTLALVCPQMTLSDKAELILSEESFSEFHEPIRLLKGRRRSVRSKTANKLAVAVGFCTKPKYTKKDQQKPLYEGEAFQAYLAKLIQLLSRLRMEA